MMWGVMAKDCMRDLMELKESIMPEKLFFGERTWDILTFFDF